MKHWRRNAIKKEKNFQRNIWIALALLFVAFIAKMEAINFLLSAFFGGFVLVKTFNPIHNSFDIEDDKIEKKFYPFPVTVSFRVFRGLLTWHVPTLIWLACGIGSGYLLYVVLNFIFISP